MLCSAIVAELLSLLRHYLTASLNISCCDFGAGLFCFQAAGSRAPPSENFIEREIVFLCGSRLGW